MFYSSIFLHADSKRYNGIATSPGRYNTSPSQRFSDRAVKPESAWARFESRFNALAAVIGVP
jgi:hypothetical protein